MLELRRRRSLGDETVSDEEVTTVPLVVNRGFIAVPTQDVQAYTQSQFVTFGAGFAIGMTVGALFGNLLSRRT